MAEKWTGKTALSQLSINQFSQPSSWLGHQFNVGTLGTHTEPLPACNKC